MDEAQTLPTIEQINSYKWEEVADRAKFPSCDEVATEFSGEAAALETQGDAIGDRVFSFLRQIAFMGLDPSNQDSPIVPAFVTPSRRSAGPQDLSEAAVVLISALAGSTHLIAFRARLADLLWILKKDHKAAARAAEDYLAAFRSAEAVGKWVWEGKGLVRGMHIARTLGKKKELYQSYVDYLETRLSEVELTCDDAFGLHLLHRLADHGAGNKGRPAQVAESIGDRLNSRSSFHLAQLYYDYATRFFHSLNDPQNARRMLCKKGESLVTQAHADVNTLGLLSATGHLARAVECLQQGQAPQQRTDEIHKLLLDWQDRSTQELKPFTSKIDITHVIEQTRKFVTGKSLQQAIFMMCHAHNLTDPAALRQRVTENLSKYPFSALFGTSIIDRHGRIQAQRPPGLTLDPKQQNEYLESETFHQATIDWNFRAQAYIEVCREVIWTEHSPELHDLEFLVLQNPFIPPGHAPIYLKAILAGFRNDFDIVAHFLIPQAEEFVRHVMTKAGHITSNLNSELIQQAGYLSKVLNMDGAKQVFGEDGVFELRGLLVEKFGYELRNKLAHGFMTYHECWSPAVVNFWWIMLRYVSVPVFRQSDVAPTGKDDPKTDGGI